VPSNDNDERSSDLFSVQNCDQMNEEYLSLVVFKLSQFESAGAHSMQSKMNLREWRQ